MKNIFLFGGDNGNIILFWEPMLTRDYVFSKSELAATILQILQHKAYPVSGYYPLSYSVI